MRGLSALITFAAVSSSRSDATWSDGAVELEELEDPELGFYPDALPALSNTTEPLLHSAEAGRLLAEEKKPKRKFCNTSAYGLKGDYAYEACGAFCKQAKAANHCKFCKCRACTFCANAQMPPLNSLAKRPKSKTKSGLSSAADGLKKPKKGKKGLKALKIKKRKLLEAAKSA
mmetsp:Transcript_69032/g.136831  ORF Transcript_69032/g.136831 Transcript_69032/m.136831 type:complete len:173 (-) Transcript_69032:296-814(-)